MSKSNETNVQPASRTADEAGTGDSPSGDQEFAEELLLCQQTDQQLATSREKLKCSAKRLVELFEMDAPSNMIRRELALITQKIGCYQSSLLDCLG